VEGGRDVEREREEEREGQIGGAERERDEGFKMGGWAETNHSKPPGGGGKSP